MSFIFFAVFFCLILFLWLDFELKNFFGLESFALFWCGIYYFFIPALIYQFPLSANERFSSFYGRPEEVAPVIVVFCYSAALFFGVALGRLTNFSGGYHLKGSVGGVAKFSYALLLLGVLAYAAFIYFYGGLVYVLENVSRIRSGVDENKNYMGAFLKIFGVYFQYGVVLFFSMLLFDEKNKSNFSKVIFIILVFFSVLLMMLDGGRGYLISFFIMLLMSYVFVHRKLPYVFLFLALFLGVFFIIFGKTFLFQIFSGQDLSFGEVVESSDFSQFVSEYSHPYLSLAVSVRDYAFDRQMIDVVAWLLKPLKLLGMAIPDSISYYNTFRVYGSWDSEIPPGLFAFLVYDFGLLGGGGILIFIGFMCVKISNFLFSYRNPISNLIYCVAMLQVWRIFHNADPALHVQAFLPFYLLLVYMLATGKVRFLYEKK